MDKEAGH